MSGPGTFEITTSKGHVYHIEAPDEATANKVGEELESNEQAGRPDLQSMDFSGTGAQAEAPTATNPQSYDPGHVGNRGKGFLDTGMGMFARGAMHGLTALPAMTVDAITGNPGEGQEAIDSVVNKLTSSLGLGEMRTPQNRLDRIISAGAEGLGGAGAAGMTSGIGARPGLQALGGATGAMSGQNVAENGGGPLEQIAASLAGGSLPTLGKTGLEAGVRGAMRGGDPSRVRDALDTFATAGAGTPTVAQATGGSGANTVEGFLSQLFGSGGVIRNKIQEQESGIGKKVAEDADSLYPKLSNEDMGAYISSNAEDGFKPQGRQMMDRAYALRDKLLPPDTRADLTPLVQYAEKKGVIDGALKRSSTNKIVGGNQEADWSSFSVDLKKDLADMLKKTGTGGAPLSSVNALRTKIGSQIENAAFNESGGDIGALRGAYGVLSETLRDAATKAGPKALKAFEDANKTANWYHQILEDTKPIIDKAGGFEKVFTSSLSGMKDGGTTLRNVYSLLSPDARQAMTSQILRRAAKAPGVNPDEFNMEAFAKNYVNMDDEAKKVIFDSRGTQYTKDLDAIAKTVQTVGKQKSDFGLATSAAQGRTGVQAAIQAPRYALAGIGGVGAGFAGAAASHPVLGLLAAGAVPAAMGGANRLAHWMTNPKTVHFLAETTKLPKEQLPIAINQLSLQAQKENDPDMQELADYLKSQQESQ